MSIADSIARVEEQISAACRRAMRPRDSVQLMAVSKTHPAAAIAEAFACGIRLFGENRVQEFAAKQSELQAAGMSSDAGPASFHLIGPLQSNKATRAAQIFDAVDAVDSLRLAQRLDEACAAAGKRLPILIEIKLSAEASKHGLAPGAEELHPLLERLPNLKNLKFRGLMTIPPYADDLEQARPYFRRLRELRDSLAQQYPALQFDELSMGMSHDFSVAIEEGSTLVRIGAAIFGARPPV
ncbi:MAG TPA: YggS family pyridoxal phosphate-dependent enzyme [Acidobacteriaceae bacterium]|nr:YggS family pyridoxal phosphate-dependent enzyme [Acidobacteriaceae bacterium]